MSTRVVVALHVAWMAVFVGLALWAGWLFRFEGGRSFYHLDRWTGELVDASGWGSESRFSLRAVAGTTDMFCHRSVWRKILSLRDAFSRS